MNNPSCMIMWDSTIQEALILFSIIIYDIYLVYRVQRHKVQREKERERMSLINVHKVYREVLLVVKHWNIFQIWFTSKWQKFESMQSLIKNLFTACSDYEMFTKQATEIKCLSLQNCVHSLCMYNSRVHIL